MRQWTLYWRTGQRRLVKGDTLVIACALAGIGGGAIRALDFYAEGDDHEWVWRPKTREWILTPSAQ